MLARPTGRPLPAKRFLVGSIDESGRPPRLDWAVNALHSSIQFVDSSPARMNRIPNRKRVILNSANFSTGNCNPLNQTQ